MGLHNNDPSNRMDFKILRRKEINKWYYNKGKNVQFKGFIIL